MAPLKESLLGLQNLDTRLDQLLHKFETLPEIQEIQDLELGSAEYVKDLAELDQKISEIRRQQKRLEDEVETEDAKLGKDGDRIGQLTDPKELQALEHAIQTRGEYKATLEDQILDCMEKLEPLESEQAAKQVNLAKSSAKTEELQVSLASQRKTIEGEVAELQDLRETALGKVEAAALELYQSLREHHGGIGVAQLVGNQCHGCDLNMIHPQSEIERFHSAAADEVLQCGECQRFLVVSEEKEAKD